MHVNQYPNIGKQRQALLEKNSAVLPQNLFQLTIDEGPKTSGQRVRRES